MRRPLKRAFILSALITTITAGQMCRPAFAQESDRETIDDLRSMAMYPLVQSKTSVEGREIKIYRFGEGAKEYIFLFGTFHGDEQQGAYMLNKLIDVFIQNPAYYLDKSIFVVPVVNPDAQIRNSRVNAHNVDLNRNFPTHNFRPGANQGTRYFSGREALSEPESRAVYDLLGPYIPTRKLKIMSIHAPLSMNNYDGAAQELAAQLQRYNHYPVRADIGYPTPGSFGSYYGKELALPVITLETSSESPELAWKRHQNALLAFIQYPDLELHPIWSPRPQVTETPTPPEEGNTNTDQPIPKRWWPFG